MRSFVWRKWLALATLLFGATLAIQAASSKASAVVKDVAFNRSGQTLEVRITATEATKFNYFELSSPRRLVVDFPGIQNGIGFKQKDVGASGVERIRTSLFTNGDRTATRVVFDLAAGVPYKVTDEGEGHIRVLFGAATENVPADSVT